MRDDITVESTYHEETLDRTGDLFRGLGTFWSDAYAGSREIYGLSAGLSAAMADPVRDFKRLSDWLSVNTVEPLTCRSWWLLILDSPERQTARSYDEDPEATVYDQIDESVSYPLPEGLVDFALATPSTSSQGKTWWLDQDVRVDPVGGRLVFREDPEPFGPRDAAGRSYIWLYRPRFSFERVYDHAGYIIGRREPDSVPYTRFVSSVVRTLTQGATELYARQAIGAAVEAPVVSVAGAVIDVADGPFGETVVVTDGEAFVIPDGQSATVAAGGEVIAGDTVSTQLEFCPHFTGEICDDVGITHRFALDGKNYWLSFSALEQEVTRPTPTTVRFPIGGDPTGIEAYWQAVDSSGRLASWIDGDTVVPAEIVADRILRYGWTTAKVDARGMSSRRADRLSYLASHAAASWRFLFLGPTSSGEDTAGTVALTAGSGPTTLSVAVPVTAGQLYPITYPDGPC